MSKLELFNNLMVLAATDGFAREEIEYLAAKSHLWGISVNDVEAAIVGSDEGEIFLPETQPEREELLREMIQLMAADGHLSDLEKRICATASAKMDFTSKQFEQLLNSLLKSE